MGNRYFSVLNVSSLRYFAPKLLKNVDGLQNGCSSKRMPTAEKTASRIYSHFSTDVRLPFFNEFSAFAFFTPAERFVFYDFAYAEAIVQFGNVNVAEGYFSAF